MGELQRPLKISVIIPMYNAEKYIEECIASIQNQTLHEIEIIIVDDRSTDASLQIANHLASLDNRIKVLQNSSNQGSGLSRNKGMEHAEGECIYFIDADDWIEQQTLAVAYETLKTYGADFVEFGIARVNENGVKRTFYSVPFEVITDRIQWIRGYMNNRYADRIFGSIHIQGGHRPDYQKNRYTERIWNKLFCAEFLRLNQLSFEQAVLIEDHLFILKMCQKMGKAVIIPDVLYNYRQHDESLTIGAVTSGKVKGYIKLISATKMLLENENLLLTETGKAFMNDRIGVTAMYVWRYMEKHTSQKADELLHGSVQEVFGENAYWIYTLLRQSVYMYQNAAEYFLQEMIQENEQIILYGAGDIGRNLCRILVNRGIEVVAFTDTNEAAWGTTFCGREIVPPEALAQLQFTKIIISVSDCQPIRDKLEGMGYKRHQDFEYYLLGF